MAEKGLYTRLLEGYEQNGEGVRNSLSKSRYQVCKDILKEHLKEVSIINVLILLFFIPLIIVLTIGYIYAQGNSVLYPFGSNLGVGYPAMPDLQGTSEWLSLQSGLYTCLGVLVASAVASVGLAGGMYSIRNLIWTEGRFVVKDFWRGVKLNYKNALQTALFFCIVLLLTIAEINVVDFNIAMGAGQVVWLRISQVVCYILLAVASLMSLWMISFGVTYKTTFLGLLKNAFLLMVGTIFQTVFFAVIALLPFALFLFGEFGGLMNMIALTLMFLVSFSFALLVWLSFTQWVFDRFITPKTQPANSNDTIYNQDGTLRLTGDDSASVLEYQRAIVEEGKSRILTTPVKPVQDDMQLYELPKFFKREDLKKLQESKDALKADAEAYAKEHEQDARYVEYSEKFDARERALKEQEEQSKKDKKKKK